MSLEPFMKKAIKVALGEGASEVEVFGSRSRTLSLYVDDDQIKNVEEKMDQGMAVRVIRAKKIGQASSTLSNIRDAEWCAQSAMKLANVSGPDPVFKSFPVGTKANHFPNTYDRTLASLTGEQLSELAVEAVQACLDKGEVKVPNGVIRTAIHQYQVMNTSNVETDQKSTMLYAHFTSMTKGDEPGEGVLSCYTPHLDRFDPVGFGAKLGSKAQAAQKAEHFKGGGKMTVILQPPELSELLDGTVGYAVNAENINRQRSPWAKSMGERVASPKVTLVDDPFDERGMCSCAYDDEGSVTKRKVLVDRGVFKTTMNDQYNALLSKTETSGNALRRIPMDVMGAYRMPLDIAPVNLVLEPGECSVNKVVEDVEKGILVDNLASAEANSITGGFGLEVRCAYLIEKGSIVGTIDHALLAGNMYDALKNVRQVCNDATVFRQTIVPSVAFDDLEVIGS